MSPTRWAIVVGLLACAVGVVLPWYSSLLLSVTGINTGDGKFFAGVLVVAARHRLVAIGATNRINGTLLFLLWGGMFALVIYEMVNVSTIFTASTMGSGLYVCAIGSLWERWPPLLTWAGVMTRLQHWRPVASFSSPWLARRSVATSTAPTSITRWTPSSPAAVRMSPVLAVTQLRLG